jgi:hypothetical protein
MDGVRKMGTSCSMALAGLALGACGGPEGGVPVESSVLQIALTAATTDESAVAVRSEDAALSVEELGLGLRSLEIVPCADDAAALGVEDYPVELTVEPAALASFESGVTDYCDLRVAIAPAPSGLPELGGLGVFVRGTRADGVPFEIRSTLELAVALASSEAFGAEHLALGFDLAAWFAGVDVDAATITGGVAVVDESANADVLEAFEANTTASIALYVDADRDAVLDADELEAIAIAGAPSE